MKAFTLSLVRCQAIWWNEKWNSIAKHQTSTISVAFVSNNHIIFFVILSLSAFCSSLSLFFEWAFGWVSVCVCLNNCYALASFVLAYKNVKQWTIFTKYIDAQSPKKKIEAFVEMIWCVGHILRVPECVRFGTFNIHFACYTCHLK